VPARSLTRIVPAAVIAAGVICGGAGGVGLAVVSREGHAATPLGRTPLVAVPAGRRAAVPGPASQHRVARPRELIIPAIGVRTRLVRLRRTAAGSLQVPATTKVAGWYTSSPRPGAIGTAVIAGHVDSYRGPGVFFRLRRLHRGAAVYVRRADRTLVEFRVTAVRRYRKVRFPTTAVYGPAPQPELRLITCGGTFDPARRSYLSNVVVYAVAGSPGPDRGGG
jgi:hypothetical protein